MATIRVKRAASEGSALLHGELAIGANILYFGNSTPANIALIDEASTQVITGSKRFQNDLNQFGIPTTSNQAEIVVNTGNAGSPQIGFTEHGDMSWAIGGDDTGNSFKITGAATAVIPTINASGTVMFELNTSGNLLISGTIQGTQLKSTIPIGTAPLTVTSTTVVPNLNASALSGSARETTLSSTLDTKIPTSKAVATYVNGRNFALTTGDTFTGVLTIDEDTPIGGEANSLELKFNYQSSSSNLNKTMFVNNGGLLQFDDIDVQVLKSNFNIKSTAASSGIDPATLSAKNLWVGTKAVYDTLTTDANTIYFCTV